MTKPTPLRFGAPDPGLCSTCRHAKRIDTDRSVFWLCGLAAHDPRFEKYPRLPVLECSGFERTMDADAE